MTNKALRNIRSLTNLIDLKLDSCPEVTDEGLKSLENLTNLVSLDLSCVVG